MTKKRLQHNQELNAFPNQPGVPIKTKTVSKESGLMPLAETKFPGPTDEYGNPILMVNTTSGPFAFRCFKESKEYSL